VSQRKARTAPDRPATGWVGSVTGSELNWEISLLNLEILVKPKFGCLAPELKIWLPVADVRFFGRHAVSSKTVLASFGL
jgi:hypothetical protein